MVVVWLMRKDEVTARDMTKLLLPSPEPKYVDIDDLLEALGG